MREPFKLCAAVAILLATGAGPVWAWGDEGHEVVALIAQSFLDPPVKRTVNALLGADPDDLVAHTIQDAATWADKYRDSDRDGARAATRKWHFVDLELTAPDLNAACFGQPRLPPGLPASRGPADDCAVDKIDAFAAELADPSTNAEERIVALKFVLHLVGDLHQPLHASDDHDRGGNDKRAGMAGARAGTLHHYWDTEFVELLGPNPSQIAASLRARITPADVQAWSRGTTSDWAFESFRLAKEDAYGRLPPPNGRGSFRLPDSYVAMAIRDAGMQLSKAGVRLAMILNRALAHCARAAALCGG